jgi:hypothetical protein
MQGDPMSGTTWEERMSLRARERAAAAKAEEPVLTPTDHLGHHIHMGVCHTECSCGVQLGTFCGFADEDYDPTQVHCEVCGAEGLTYSPDLPPPVTWDFLSDVSG